MKPERALAAERPLAQHCQELLRAEPGPAEVLPLLGLVAERFSRALAHNFAHISGRAAPAIIISAPRDCGVEELTGEIAPLAANSLLAAGINNAPFLASIEAEEVLRMVDRTFGGKGVVPSPLPDTFPLSAELMIARMEMLVVDAMTQALGHPEGGSAGVLRRDSSLVRLAPFTDDLRLTVLTFTITEKQSAPWRLTLAFPTAMLSQLLAHGEAINSLPAPPRPALDPLNGPASDVPLGIGAVLVDMTLPFATLSRLEAGQILPVAVARKIPLRIGEQTIAHGTIGEVDDRIAVQITQVF